MARGWFSGTGGRSSPPRRSWRPSVPHSSAPSRRLQRLRPCAPRPIPAGRRRPRAVYGDLPCGLRAAGPRGGGCRSISGSRAPGPRSGAGGLFTTIQDLGRPGYRRFGLPQSGAMDPLALRVTNLLLGNPQGAAALEFTFPAPRLVVARRTAGAFGGADFSPTLNGRPVPTWTALALQEGDILGFGAPRTGQWCYLALPGGIDVPSALGSCATYRRHGWRRFIWLHLIGDNLRATLGCHEDRRGSDACGSDAGVSAALGVVDVDGTRVLPPGGICPVVQKSPWMRQEFRWQCRNIYNCKML